MNKLKRTWRQKLVSLTDVFIIAFSYAAAFFIRFDGVLPQQYWDMLKKTLPLVLGIRMAAMIYFRIHKGMWKYASIEDLTQILKAVAVSSIIIIAAVMLTLTGYPRSVFVIDWLLLVITLSGIRFIIRITRPIRWRNINNGCRRKKLLIVGAGDAGEIILRDIIYNFNNNYEVVGLIDDDPLKHLKSLHGIPVLGPGSDIPEIVMKNNVDEIVIAIPSLKSDQMRDIVNYCIKSRAKYRTVPNISDLVNGSVKVSRLREVRLEDLLSRDEVILNRRKQESYIKGKTVLITGAGGSIGSELCRQVAGLSPKKLLLFDKAENPLFYIDMELGQYFEGLEKAPLVGDICDRQRVEEVFAKYRPDIIFHAAAHKHVPLMEHNYFEAIKNNVFGTKVLAEEAVDFGVERFVMLSTDKAVEPMSFMGVSKKIAEMLITAVARKYGTKFAVVRFGNVLGSEGSVVKIFKKQIASGGPVTVTHPDIRRYFMTVPEAAGLVIEAGLMGRGGEIFILEMGTQARIVDLARDMIRLSGLQPEKDIKIVFTGLRKGEKMYEMLFDDSESVTRTDHDKIMVVKSDAEEELIFKAMEQLERLVMERNAEALVDKLQELVPGYMPGVSPTDLIISAREEII
ncbi:MAG: polysaccharide biosynthesis protein [Nitrospirae bacterium]|nr:polysaccharide biosynthesis protein [Nitrospirota bacterium]